MKVTKKLRGFTLIELMIVIAIIALLIIALMPHIGLIKNKSRESGIRKNMGAVRGLVESVINDYTATAEGVAALEARIAADVVAVTIDNQKLTNPVTGGTEIGNDPEALTSAMAIAYLPTTDDTALGVDVDENWDGDVNTGLANSAGIIAYCAYVNTDTPNRINVLLIPYGIDNKRISDLEEIISQ